ncbi:hypothetical protein [Halorhabdus amylolytica]|uniref:hypothetical protein n=1 Tax=Halorhabdus amylolytica TaxID=2559573 RepID=UPI0010A9A4A3|nr:hypothetical protein [Halorhabdus amylolytica]
MESRHFYGTTFGLVGTVLAAVQVTHAVEQTDVAVAIAVDGVPFALLGLSLSFVGYWLATHPAFEPDLPRIATWALGGTVLLAAVAALTLFSQRVATGSLGRVAYVTADSVTVGAVAGTVVGLYDAQGQRHLRELERERDRTADFARKAADLNNYGRALAQAATVEEVGAYCIEGLSALLDHDETAFVEVGVESEHVASSTVSTVEDGTLRSLARRAADDDAVVAVREGNLPGPVASVLTIRLESTASTSGVLIAVGEGAGTLSSEDEQLLELLASHASMVLDRIYRGEPDELVDDLR